MSVKFSEIETLLLQTDCLFAVPFVHGVLTLRAVCPNNHFAFQHLWQQQNDKIKDVIEREKAQANLAEGRQKLQEWCTSLTTALQNDAFQFSLMLQDEYDDLAEDGQRISIQEQADQLRDWVSGFLLAWNADSSDEAKTEREAVLADEECQSFFTDLDAIANVAALPEDEDSDGELALFEVEEYVRTGVLHVFFKLAQK